MLYKESTMLSENDKNELNQSGNECTRRLLGWTLTVSLFMFGGGGFYIMHQHNQLNAEINKAQQELNKKLDVSTRIKSDLIELEEIKTNNFKLFMGGTNNSLIENETMEGRQ